MLWQGHWEDSGAHGWLERGKKKACSLAIIPTGMKKKKIPLFRERGGVWEVGAASVVWAVTLWLCR